MVGEEVETDKPIYAAIDCGTNSTRLLIGDGERRTNGR